MSLQEKIQERREKALQVPCSVYFQEEYIKDFDNIPAAEDWIRSRGKLGYNVDEFEIKYIKIIG